MSTWRLTLAQLSDSLPTLSKGGDTADQARGVLRHLINRALLLTHNGTAQVPRDPLTCPNCSAETPSVSSPYCSDLCREEAAFVRQLRTRLASGEGLDVDRQVSFGQNLWHLLGGGYPHRVTLIPPKALAKILSRGCEGCGAAAITVDHTGSG